MSVEQRVERIRAEKEAEKVSKTLLRQEKETEFVAHARFVNSRLEELRELGVVGIIEEFIKSPVTKTFILEDREIEAENKPSPDPIKWPSAEEIRESFDRINASRKWWSAQVQPPKLDSDTLEWDTNLRIKIEYRTNELPSIRLRGASLGWIDLVWFNQTNILSIEGQDFTSVETVSANYAPHLNSIEENIAQAVVNPKREPSRPMRPFDRHTPIGAHA